MAARAAAYELSPGVANPPGYLITGLVAPVGFLGEHASFRAYEQDVERRLLLYEPTYYEGGWILLRLRPGGPGSATNGVLAPLARGAAARLVPAARAWEAGFLAAQVELLGCSATLPRGDAAVRACLRGAGRGLLAAEKPLDLALAAALAGRGGGCAELGALARTGAGQVAADVARLRGTGREQALAALSAFAVDVNDRDLPGRLARFLLLCYPRPLPAGVVPG